MKNAISFVLLLIALSVLPNAGRAEEVAPLVHEVTVNGPLDQVWAAYTTKAGLESWMTPHADVQLKVGGSMKVQYGSQGTTDDPKAIVNTILSYEPMRMYSFKVAKPPEGFPFPTA